MPTYADLQADIADSIDDTTGEYTAQIKKAILKAIRYCERTGYYFNETRDVTFPTAQGRNIYTSADNAEIASLVRIEAAFIIDASTQVRLLSPADPKVMEYLSDNSAARGQPYWFCYFAQSIRLYPIPDATPYTVRLQLSPYRLTALSADSDTNAWLTEAYDMVMERAKFHLAADTLKDEALAMASLQLYQEQEAIVSAETSKRASTGFIRPTDF